MKSSTFENVSYRNTNKPEKSISSRGLVVEWPLIMTRVEKYWGKNGKKKGRVLRNTNMIR